jgi:hypothetical protein
MRRHIKRDNLMVLAEKIKLCRFMASMAIKN